MNIPFLECIIRVSLLSPGNSVHENPLSRALCMLILWATMKWEWYISILPLKPTYFTENFSLSLLFQPFTLVLHSDHTYLPEIACSYFSGLGMIYKKVSIFPDYFIWNKMQKRLTEQKGKYKDNKQQVV